MHRFPRAGYDTWYVYDYFPATLGADLGRYPSGGQIVQWMIGAGFREIRWRVCGYIRHTFVGGEVLHDPVLDKKGTSQLALLTDEVFADGMDTIRRALDAAEAAGEQLSFHVDLAFPMVSGRMPS